MTSVKTLLCNPADLDQIDLNLLVDRNNVSEKWHQSSRKFYWLHPEKSLEYPLKFRLPLETADDINREDGDDIDGMDAGDPEKWVEELHPFYEIPETPEDFWLDSEKCVASLRRYGIQPERVYNHIKNNVNIKKEDCVKWDVFQQYMLKEMSDELTASYFKRWCAIAQPGDLLDFSTQSSGLCFFLYEDGGYYERDTETDEVNWVSGVFCLKRIEITRKGALMPKEALDFLITYGPEFWRDVSVNMFKTYDDKVVVSDLFQDETVELDGVTIPGRFITL